MMTCESCECLQKEITRLRGEWQFQTETLNQLRREREQAEAEQWTTEVPIRDGDYWVYFMTNGLYSVPRIALVKAYWERDLNDDPEFYVNLKSEAINISELYDRYHNIHWQKAVLPKPPEA
jgi:hypothetical protein